MHNTPSIHGSFDPIRASGRFLHRLRPGAFLFPAILCLLTFAARTGAAATFTPKNVSVTLTAANFGLSAAQAHANWSGTSTLDGGDVSGTDLGMSEGTSIVTRTGLLFWTYQDTNKSRTITASYTITNPTLTISGVSSSVTKVTITNITTSSITYSTSTKLYSGYASMTLDLSNATRSGTYRTTGSTVTITVTVI